MPYAVYTLPRGDQSGSSSWGILIMMATAYLFFISYIAGLLLSGFCPDWGLPLPGVVSHITINLGMVIALSSGAIASLLLPRLWRMGPKPSIWLIAGLVGVMAGGYIQLRSPNYTTLIQPLPTHQQPIFPIQVGVQGDIIDAPQLTRSQSVRFTLHVTQIQSWDETIQSHVSPSARPSALTPVIASQAEPKSTELDSADATTRNILAHLAHKLYVTVPLLEGTGLKPGDAIALHGRLYRPSTTAIPGAFNFRHYLERQGIFVALHGRGIQPTDIRPPLGRSALMTWRRATWTVRQRVIHSFIQGLDSPAGPLLSAMVLGRKAVDLPFEIRDQFIQSGLAHILAASGFHVSLLLGVVLIVGRHLSPQQRFWLGSSILIGYASLTGLQPSVCRAVLMGLAVLIATATDRRVRPLGALLLIATMLLLIKPQWVWDLGFQLSFLATVGLVVTMPWLMKRMTRLPPAIAGLIAVPIAAMVWTLPLLLSCTARLLPYSPLLSVLTTPLITLISLGGMITGAIALLLPPLGSGLAGVLYWPIQGLIAFVTGSNQLPGQSIALGAIDLWQLVLIYSAYTLMMWWGQPSSVLKQFRPFGIRSWHRVISILILSSILVPLGYARYHKVQVTIFPSSNLITRPPLMLIQNRGHIGLINNGTADDVQYTLLPFLRHEGINQIDWAITTPNGPHPPQHSGQNSGHDLRQDPGQDPRQTAWQELAHTIPIRQFYQLPLPDVSPQLSAALSSDASPKQSLEGPSEPSALGDNDITTVATLQPGRSLQIGSHGHLTLLASTPAILEIVLDQQRWLLIDQATPSFNESPLPSSDIWYWTGSSMNTTHQVLQQLPQEVFPKQAIITPVLSDADALRSRLIENTIALYSPSRNRVVQWVPDLGFSLASDKSDADITL